MVPERWMVLEVERQGSLDPDLVADVLIEFGGRGVVENVDKLVTYLEPPEAPEGLVAQVVARLAHLVLPGAPEPAVSWGWQAQEDWAEVWKRGLHPRRVSSRLVITPSWEAARTGPDQVVVTIDPGMAFGTAEHATTRGCLRLLDPLIGDGDRVLDVGAGSAILSIAAVLLGAADALAVDSDPYACEAALENVVRNGVADRVEVSERMASAEWLESLDLRDGVVANIETGFLLPLVPGIAKAVRPGGWVILSGILESEREKALEAAERSGLTLLGEDREDEWWNGLFRRSSI